MGNQQIFFFEIKERRLSNSSKNVSTSLKLELELRKQSIRIWDLLWPRDLSQVGSDSISTWNVCVTEPMTKLGCYKIRQRQTIHSNQVQSWAVQSTVREQDKSTSSLRLHTTTSFKKLSLKIPTVTCKRYWNTHPPSTTPVWGWILILRFINILWQWIQK